MAEYRAHLMSDDDRIIRAIDLECRDDDAAKELVKKVVDGHDIELWQLDRKVATFRHKPE
jgi:hypothetical protein